MCRRKADRQPRHWKEIWKAGKKGMNQIEIRQYVVGPVQTNCYFAIHKETKQTLVIDPGASAPQLIRRLREGNLISVAVLLTHGHFDHATAAADVAEAFGIPVYALDKEKETLESVELNASWMVGDNRTFSADEFLHDGQEIELAGFRIQVLFTPGHTPGGCCYYLPDEGVLFAGDTLFCESVGRTDFAKGSMSDLVQGIRTKLMSLPDDTLVCTGHGERTTIGHERMYNPYL